MLTAVSPAGSISCSTSARPTESRTVSAHAIQPRRSRLRDAAQDLVRTRGSLFSQHATHLGGSNAQACHISCDFIAALWSPSRAVTAEVAAAAAMVAQVESHMGGGWSGGHAASVSGGARMGGPGRVSGAAVMGGPASMSGMGTWKGQAGTWKGGNWNSNWAHNGRHHHHRHNRVFFVGGGPGWWWGDYDYYGQRLLAMGRDAARADAGSGPAAIFTRTG